MRYGDTDFEEKLWQWINEVERYIDDSKSDIDDSGKKLGVRNDRSKRISK